MVWLFAFLTSMSFASIENEAPFPKNWCKFGDCSELQKVIWEDFNNGTSPEWENAPMMMSGSCYHSSRHYNNKHEHFSGLLIDREEDGKLSLYGRHYFFAPSNPYLDLNVESAREEFKTYKTTRIEEFPTYGYFNTDPNESGSIRYWLRQGSDGNIKVATVWGSLSHFSLCDLKVHEN